MQPEWMQSAFIHEATKDWWWTQDPVTDKAVRVAVCTQGNRARERGEKSSVYVIAYA